jgi:hypothetical protein
MSHTHKLPSFKHLLKNSWHFYKANWKKLVGVFLPIELALLVLTLVITFGFTPARFSLIAFIASIFILAMALLQIFKKMMIFSGGLIATQIENGEKMSVGDRYKEIFTQTVPIAWVAILGSLYMCAVAAASLAAALIVFFFPFILFGLLARVFPSMIDFISLNGGAISIGIFIIAAIGFVVSNIYFALRVWFSSYTLLLEGKDGLDALASSSMFVRGRSWQIFWRMLVIGIIAILPILIILGPIYVKILIEAAKGMAIAFALGLKPVFPPIATNLILWRSVLALIANIIWAPIFVVLNYFLWKDVKATALTFEEVLYTKTRKRIKICVWVGLVLVAIAPIIGLFVGLASVFAR